MCGSHFCKPCAASRFTSRNSEATDLATWAAAAEAGAWICFVCSGECNWCVATEWWLRVRAGANTAVRLPTPRSSAKNKHYFGRVSATPTGSLALERSEYPSMTPNEIILARPRVFQRHSPFPFQTPGRFPHALAGQRHVGDLAPKQVCELKAGFPKLVASYVRAREAQGRPLTDAEAVAVDAVPTPTLRGWTDQWGVGSPKVAAVGAQSAVLLALGAAGGGAAALA